MLSITGTHTELEEDGMRISLTVVDTPGFGDAIDNDARCVPSLIQSIDQLVLRER